jgi:hypothetical protein
MMELDPVTMKRARLALKEAVSKHLFDRNVSMVDFGFPEHEGRIVEDEIAIRIHVHKKFFGPQLEAAVDFGITNRIPESIGGFQTDVPEGSYYPSFMGWWMPRSPRAMRLNPMRGGISISNAKHYSYATLGALVKDRTSGEDMILSNWHVLAGDWSARPGLGVLQPGRLDGGSSLDQVGSLTRDVMDLNLDAAVASLNGARSLINDQVDLGSLTGLRAAELGLNVSKSGRRTGITRARVTAIEGVARIPYSGVYRLIRRVVTLEPRSPWEQTSQGGDSGSIWVQEDTREAIGLHFAGSDYPERALCMDIQAVLEALDVDLVTETARPILRPERETKAARERVYA